MANTEQYGSGTTPRKSDTERMLMVKELIATNAGAGGGAGTGTFSGAGSPQNVVTASPGATYLDTSTGSFWAKSTGVGNSGWLQLIA